MRSFNFSNWLFQSETPTDAVVLGKSIDVKGKRDEEKVPSMALDICFSVGVDVLKL
jgi:hypothetical protein